MIYLLEYENENNDKVEFSIESGIVISTITGLTSNSIRLSESQGMMQIGSTVLARSVASKPITVNGEIIGLAKEKKQKLLNAILPEVVGTLIYDKKWKMQVETVMSPDIQSNLRDPKFQFMLKAPFPYWESTTPTVSRMSGETALFEFWDLTQDVIFGERYSNPFTLITNNGNAASFFTVTFTAIDDVENPKITNAETLEFFRIKHNMESGDKIIVRITQDTVRITKTDGVTTQDISGSMDIYSTLSQILPGSNALKIEADSGIEFLDATVTHSDTVVGVFHEN